MAFIPEEVIAQVLERCDIVETIASYVPLKSAGRNFKANCPFHNEKTASFTVNPEKQIFRCFGCGVAGNVFTFVMKQERLEFPEVVRMLAAKVNVSIPESYSSDSSADNLRQKIFKVNELAVDYFCKNLLFDKSDTSEDARQYLKDRGFTLEAVKQFRIGLALNQWDGLLEYLKSKEIPLSLMEKAGLIIARNTGEGYYDRFRNRIIFPIADTRGHFRAFGARTLEIAAEQSDKVTAKYINSPETPIYIKGHHLYGFYLARQAISKEDAVILVEGYTDCVMPYQAGVTNIVASLGTALTVEQIRLLRRYTKNIFLLFDMDNAGEAAMLRSIDTLIEEGMNVRVANLDEGQDPDSFIRQHGVEAFRSRILEAQELFDYKLNILKQQYNVGLVEGKTRISHDMLATISRFPDAIIQSEYIKRLAQELNIAEQALMTELKKIGNNSFEKKFSKVTHNEVHPVYQKTKEVERGVLKLLLNDFSFISSTKEFVGLSDFQDGEICKVISKIYELFDQGKEITVGSLINSFNDEATQRMIAGLAIDDRDIAGDKEKMHRDYLSRIKNNKLKVKMKSLQEQIRMAEGSGDQEQLECFIKEYHLLLKEKV